MVAPFWYPEYDSSRGMRGALLLAQPDGPRPSATAITEAALGRGSSSLETSRADEQQEEWRAVVGFEGKYEVSPGGYVRSLIGRCGPRKLLKTFPVGLGNRAYPRVNLSLGSHRFTPKAVHRLVLEAFRGPCPAGYQARHLNGDPKDSRLANLVWGTPKENTGDQVRHGTRRRGTRVYNAKLTETAVIEIRRKGGSTLRLAREYGVGRSTIDRVLKGESWGHVDYKERSDG